MTARFRSTYVLCAVLAYLLVCSAEVQANPRVDVTTVEYLDLVETADGSIWTGVITELAPALHFKLATADGGLRVLKAADVVRVTKQRNPAHRPTRALAVPADRTETGGEERESQQAPAGMTAAGSGSSGTGLRLEPELAIIIPRGDLTNLADSGIDYGTSIAPGVRAGYQVSRGDIAWTLGVFLRHTSWVLPPEVRLLGTHATTETHAFGRAAYHAGRFAPYAALGLGLDINRTSSNISQMSTTAIGFGMNVQAGVSFAATPNASFDIGVDLHPGTDTIDPAVDASVSYYALRFGASFRL